jgi:hypothetical protein
VDAAAVWTADGWDDANGSGGIGWERSRSSAQRQASRLHEFSQKHAGVPSGPDGPGIGSPKGVPGSMQRNPGRPDWHRMLTGNAGGLRGRLKSSERSERSDRSEELSAGSSDELTYPDEMSEVPASPAPRSFGSLTVGTERTFLSRPRVFDRCR